MTMKPPLFACLLLLGVVVLVAGSKNRHNVPRCHVSLDDLNVLPQHGLICAEFQHMNPHDDTFILAEEHVILTYKLQGEDVAHRLLLSDEFCHTDRQFVRKESHTLAKTVLCGRPAVPAHVNDNLIFVGPETTVLTMKIGREVQSCRLSTNLVSNSVVLSTVNVNEADFCGQSVCEGELECKQTCSGLLEGNGTEHVCIRNGPPKEVIEESVVIRGSQFFVIWREGMLCMDLTVEYVHKMGNISAVVLLQEQGTDIQFEAEDMDDSTWLAASVANNDHCQSLNIPFYNGVRGHVCALFPQGYLKLHIQPSNITLLPDSRVSYKILFSDSTVISGSRKIHYTASQRLTAMYNLLRTFCTREKLRECGKCATSCSFRLRGFNYPVLCTNWYDKRIWNDPDWIWTRTKVTRFMSQLAESGNSSQPDDQQTLHQPTVPSRVIQTSSREKEQTTAPIAVFQTYSQQKEETTVPSRAIDISSQQTTAPNGTKEPVISSTNGASTPEREQVKGAINWWIAVLVIGVMILCPVLLFLFKKQL